MTSNERVRVVRKSLGLTLEKFGVRLGVGKGAMSQIENGTNNLSQRMLLSICREYGVSESWLRTGEGEMFVPVTRNEKIASFIGDLLKDEQDSFKKQLVEILAELDESEWEALAAIAERLKKD